MLFRQVKQVVLHSRNHVDKIPGSQSHLLFEPSACHSALPQQAFCFRIDKHRVTDAPGDIAHSSAASKTSPLSHAANPAAQPHGWQCCHGSQHHRYWLFQTCVKCADLYSNLQMGNENCCHQHGW